MRSLIRSCTCFGALGGAFGGIDYNLLMLIRPNCIYVDTSTAAARKDLP